MTSLTPVQSPDPAFMEMYRQTQVLLSDFLKEKNQQNSKRQPFYNFVTAEADRFTNAYYDRFQTAVLNLLQKYKRAQ